MKQEIYTYEEYKEKFHNNYIFYNEKIYNELEDLLEDYELIDESIYGVYEEEIKIDIEETISRTEIDSNVEDFEFYNTEELIEFVNEWNERNSRMAYYPDRNIIIDISKEI